MYHIKIFLSFSWSELCNASRVLHRKIPCFWTEVRAFTWFVLLKTPETHQLWMDQQLTPASSLPLCFSLSLRSVMVVYREDVVCSDQPSCCQQVIGGGETSVSCDRMETCREKWHWQEERQRQSERKKRERAGWWETDRKTDRWREIDRKRTETAREEKKQKETLHMWTRNLIEMENIAWGSAKCIKS